MNDPLLLLCYMSILFAANVLGAVGGFGAGMISIPFLTQLFDAKAVIMASTMTCVLNLFIAVKNWRHVDLKRLFRILFYMCIGLPIGVYGLKTLDVDALKHLLGGFMLVIGGYGIMKLWIPRAAGVHLPAWALRGCLIAGGIVQGAISSGGSLILLYAQQELEGGNLGKLRERFKPHGITLTASARLVKQDDRYVIEDDQEVEGTVRPVVFDIIYCVDEYYVYMLLRKEVDTWRRNR